MTDTPESGDSGGGGGGDDDDVPTASHQFDARKRPWRHWKSFINLTEPLLARRSRHSEGYHALGGRLNELFVLDYACSRRHNAGILEVSLALGVVSEDDLRAVWNADEEAFTIELPDDDSSGVLDDEAVAEALRSSDADDGTDDEGESSDGGESDGGD